MMGFLQRGHSLLGLFLRHSLQKVWPQWMVTGRQKSSTQIGHLTYSYNCWNIFVIMGDNSLSGLKRKSSENFRVRLSPGEHILRAKIKVLQGQIQTLQGGMNVFADISTKKKETSSSESRVKCDHGKTIEDLMSKITKLENRNKSLVNQNCVLQKSLTEMTSQMEIHRSQAQELQSECDRLQELCKHKDHQLYEKELENRYLQEAKEELERDLNKLKQELGMHLTRLEKLAHKISLVLLKSEDHQSLKDEIFRLKKRIHELELDREWATSGKELERRRESTLMQYPCSNIGEEIVRLKRNIDKEIAGDHTSQYTDSFLNKYREVQNSLSNLTK